MPTEEKQLTAMMQIEQCFDKLQMWLTGDHKATQYNLQDFAKDIESAKATERQQLIDAHKDGATFVFKNSETYYNGTFKTQ